MGAGGELAPGAASLEEVVTLLDADEERAIHGADVLLERLEAFTKNTVQSLDGLHFDIDARIRQCDVRLAPEGAAAAPYYISPSEDLSRPGTTWFPTRGATRFTWWRYVSMWYHEAVPGHHLQIGTALLQADRLSRFHRLDGSTSGYSEGWALYAERLMDELGGYVDPADEMGYLAAQALRAARIVIDLGLHLGLAAPDDLGVLGDLGDCSGATWSVEMAVALLEEWAIQPNDFATSEVDRYLSIPGQATSYKVGERTSARSARGGAQPIRGPVRHQEVPRARFGTRSDGARSVPRRDEQVGRQIGRRTKLGARCPRHDVTDGAEPRHQPEVMP